MCCDASARTTKKSLRRSQKRVLRHENIDHSQLEPRTGIVAIRRHFAENRKIVIESPKCI